MLTKMLPHKAHFRLQNKTFYTVQLIRQHYFAARCLKSLCVRTPMMPKKFFLVLEKSYKVFTDVCRYNVKTSSWCTVVCTHSRSSREESTTETDEAAIAAEPIHGCSTSPKGMNTPENQAQTSKPLPSITKFTQYSLLM